jgi:PAS domain S-box-containing protein
MSAKLANEQFVGPQPLQTYLNIIMATPVPMIIFWGKDLVCYYSESVVHSFHLQAPSGQKGQTICCEKWPHIESVISKVFVSGHPQSITNVLNDLSSEDIYRSDVAQICYSPITDNNGIICGVLAVVAQLSENTAFFILDTARKKIEESEKTFRNIIRQAPVAICIFRGLSFVIEIANDRMFEFWGRASGDVLGKPLFEALPEAKHQGFEELLNAVLTNGVPFSARELPVVLPRGETAQTVFIDFAYEPIREVNGNISGIMAVAIDVTQQVMSRSKIQEVVTQQTSDLANANANLVLTNTELKRSNAKRKNLHMRLQMI